MSEIEQMVNEVVSSTRERIVRRFVGGEAIKWILEASPEIVEECLRQRIKELEGWEDVVRKCEDLFQCPDGHAESPSMSNLSNLIRDLIGRVRT